MKLLVHLIVVFMGIFMSTSVKAELIILAAPPTHLDSYYTEVLEDIIEFQVGYAQTIASHGDDVLILSNEELYDVYAEQIGKDKVVVAPMLDIWMRDFTVLNANQPVMFRYSAAGQGHSQKDADAVQEAFAAVAVEAGITFDETDLINDGGNFVDDYAGNVVISKKFLKDNNLSEDQARNEVSKVTNVKNIAFVEADEQGGLEHADGVVSFVDENTLMINSYPEDKAYADQLKASLRLGLPNVQIHEIVTPYDDRKIYDERFGSACGLYTNALVTPKRIYFPQFGIPEDTIALEQIKAVASREVVPVASHQVCNMGGGVRCMSLQLRGTNAQKMLRYAKDIQSLDADD